MKPRHKPPKDAVKALKKAAREEFGMEVTRMSSNRKKYVRSREKRRHRDINEADDLD